MAVMYLAFFVFIAFIPSLQAAEPADGCFTNPLLGISGLAIVPDKYITASSQYGVDYQPAYGRLNGNRGDGWCAKEANRNDDWLQVDFGIVTEVCAVASQGDRNGNEWVTDFKLSYSSDGKVWTPYKDANGVEVEFHRQGDSNTVDQHRLPVPISASLFRFHPTKQHKWNCLRVELYSEPANYCFKNPAGISDQAKIPDKYITASSQYGVDYQPAYGRLNGDRGDGWCAKEANKNDDWLQVDLGAFSEVCAVASQGDRNGNEWVTDFKLSYSSIGIIWSPYTDANGVEVEFHRQGDSNTVVQHRLPLSVYARYVRFHPTKQHNWNCLRVEVYIVPPTHCWYCEANTSQEKCDKEMHYRECNPGDMCFATNGLDQPYYERGCDSDLEWQKYRCEHRMNDGLLCEVGTCPGDCIANVGNEGGPFKCPVCTAPSEEECNHQVKIITCDEDQDVCIKLKNNKTGIVVRHCATQELFQKYKDSTCSDGSCEVSMCSESYCVP
ncbi:lactadherin-like isoform X1 [Oculina patagonica]